MSFKNQLNFNISKSTPTTSTNNTNTTSNSNLTSNDNPQPVTVKPPPFISNILLKSNFDSSVSTNNSSKTPPKSSSPRLSATGVVPAVVTIDNGESVGNNVSTTSTNSSKTDLIGLFDKFDINKDDKEQAKTEHEEHQPFTEKHEDDEVSQEDKLEKMVSDDDGDDGESPKEKEAVSEKEGTSTKDITLSPSIKQTEQKNNGTTSFAALMTIQPYILPEEKEVAEKQEEAVNDNLIDLDDTETLSSKNHNLHDDLAKSESTNTNQVESSTPKGNLLDIAGSEKEQSAVEELSIKVGGSESKSTNDVLTQDVSITDPNKAHKHRFQVNDSSEQNKQSHKPFDFQTFLVQLRKKSADPIVRYIRSFLGSFIRQGHTFTSDQRIKIISDFKIFMNEKFTLYEPFASMDQIDLENSREGLEKLIMNRLHDLCFPAEVIKQHLSYIPESYTLDLQKDESFAVQLEKFSWINGNHLDIDINELANKIVKNDQSFLEYAITELNKINNYRAPRDKIICILNACKIIFSYLKLSKQETNADSFIPILILVIFKAKTDHLISNIHYIENFRGQEWLLHGETSYYLSSIQGAIEFIQNITAEDLTISQAEFDAHMEAWEAQGKQKLQQLKLVQPIPTIPTTPTDGSGEAHLKPDTPNTPNGLSPSKVLFSSAEMFTKSITNFLSPSPHLSESEPEEFQPPANPPPPQEQNDPSAQYQPLPPREEEINAEQMRKAYDTLIEIFPSLDTNILKDVIFINRGNIDVCIDACLQLVDG
ncbi:ubiquitin-binding protein, putative [Candida dubliniensis CD36]|uniref:Vacuolar protein sorting-associated protein, putative n=1 Tax=Candida dubliniensis (strain CD36 / ATCC MYA-646 / CBS 7987 / NCPF 3949 / NRRL Y-17841) TaxID=573826 RepID=B9WIX4_CANDC|nr:ubiquitin-binding protein, putative [Candida dubliniensis CD36]CAX41192.1 ubiquitin-binding protein, putative [Candida dubliniensis CD36]